jgi:predicted metalloprotease
MTTGIGGASGAETTTERGLEHLACDLAEHANASHQLGDERVQRAVRGMTEMRVVVHAL